MAVCTFQSSLSVSAQTQLYNGRSVDQRVPRLSSSLPFGNEFTVRGAHLRSRGNLSRLNVSCMAQGDQDKKVSMSDVPASSASPTGAVPPLPAGAGNVVPPSSKPVTSKKVSTNFGDIFAFTGPAPEQINGRLAMLGFVSAIGVEIATGQDLVGQLSNGGLTWFLLVSTLFTSASLIPLFKGVTAESKSQGFFSSQAETLNGRAAMVGLVALVLTEYVKGSALL